jgi:hypothetical protein
MNRGGRAPRNAPALFTLPYGAGQAAKRKARQCSALSRVFPRLCLKLHLADVNQKAVPFSQHPADVSQKAVPFSQHPADVSQKAVPFSQHPADVSQKAAPFSQHPADVSQKAAPFSQHPADVNQNRYGFRFAQLGIRNVQ